jgi:predicted Zn-dependent peptidase
VVEPTLGGTVREHVVSEVPLPRLMMAFRVPPYSSDDFAVAEVSRALLGMGRASRLYRRLVRERRIAKSVASYVYPLLSGSSMMLVWATGYPGGDLAALEDAMSEELLALTGAEPPELERAIMLAETDLVHALERMAGRADLLSMFELYFGDPDRLNRELDRLSAISVEQIRTFATERLGADNRAVLTYEPTDAARSGSAA